MAPHMSSKTGGWGQWSDWIWNADYQRYYRQRQDINGQLEYDWAAEGPSNVAEVAHAAETPRDSGVDEISQGLQSTHLQGSSLPSDYSSRSNKYTLESKSSTSRSKSSTSKSKSSSSKSKGKGRVYQDDEEDYDEGEETERETQPARTSRQPASTSQTQAYQDPQTGQYYYPAETTQSSYTTSARASTSAYDAASAHSSRSRSSYSQQYSQTTYDDVEDDDPDLAAAMAASARQNRGSRTAGESSAASAYTYYEEETQPVATTSAGSSSFITGTQGVEEQLDPRYRVEPSHKFQPGEIFKVLWSEPQGSAEGTPSLVSDRFEYRDKYGGRIFVGFRRFIVIANDQGHCTCVPIFTYGGKGCNKRGIKPEKHGIIHERNHKARLLSSEPKLGFQPVRVEMSQDGEKLSKESRANYSKLITVEHNVKVFFVGRVMAADWEIVSDAVNKCWEDKTHHKKKHSR